MNWQEHLKTWNYPHRFYISYILSTFGWFSLMEIDCGAGPNLVNILKSHKRPMQLGGTDINKKALDIANKVIIGGLFKMDSGDNIMMSDKSTDVVLTDDVLSKLKLKQAKKYFKEIKRITRNYVVLCELHEQSFLKRLKLKIKGQCAYNYKQLLPKLGFYDIRLYKVPKEDGPYWHYKYVIVAKPFK